MTDFADICTSDDCTLALEKKLIIFCQKIIKSGPTINLPFDYTRHIVVPAQQMNSQLLWHATYRCKIASNLCIRRIVGDKKARIS